MRSAGTMSRVLVSGGAGTVGGALLAAAPADIDVHATQRRRPVAQLPGRPVPAHTVDLAEAGAFDALLARVRPDLVVHTAYDKTDGDRDIVAATAAVVGACRALGVALVHLSSDVVFDGEHAPYSEEAQPSPVSVYGRWKAEAEGLALRAPGAAVVRTSLVVRTAPLDPGSAGMVNELRAGRRPLFTDELRCPIRCDDFTAQLWEVVALDPGRRAGVWHLVGPEALSRFALGLMIARHAGLSAPVRTARNAEADERRPRDLRLTSARADRQLNTRARPVSTLLADIAG